MAFYPCFFLAFTLPAFYRIYRYKTDAKAKTIGDFRIWDYHMVLYLLFSIPSFMDIVFFCIPLKTFADLINYWYMQKIYDALDPCELDVM